MKSISQSSDCNLSDIKESNTNFEKLKIQLFIFFVTPHISTYSEYEVVLSLTSSCFPAPNLFIIPQISKLENIPKIMSLNPLISHSYQMTMKRILIVYEAGDHLLLTHCRYRVPLKSFTSIQTPNWPLVMLVVHYPATTLPPFTDLCVIFPFISFQFDLFYFTFIFWKILNITIAEQ